MSTFYGYTRYSSAQQGGGVTIASQISKIEARFEIARATHPDLVMGEIFEDLGYSAWRLHLEMRPAGKALRRILNPGDHVAFAAMDRGFRRVQDFSNQVADWERAEITLHFSDLGVDLSTAAGKMVAQVAVVYAELHSSIISERTRAALAVMRQMKNEGRLMHPRKRIVEKLGPVYAAKTSHIDATGLGLSLHSTDLLPPGRFYRYIRVSHPDKVERGYSLEAQSQGSLRRRTGLLMSPEYANVWVPEEECFADPGVSAFKKDLRDRPGGRLLDAVLQAGDHVIVDRMDRAFRSILDFALTWKAWRARGIRLHLVDQAIDLESPTGRLFGGMMALFAEWESAVKSDKIKSAFQEIRAKGLVVMTAGKRCGMKLITHNKRQTLVKDRKQQAVYRYIYYLRNIEGLGKDLISDRIEKIMQKREGRDHPRPRFTVERRGVKHTRAWTPKNVSMAIENHAKWFPGRYDWVFKT